MLDSIKLRIRRIQWRLKNQHNGTWQENRFPHDLVTVGKGTYGPIYVSSFGDDYGVLIGDYCSIAHGVKFIVNNDHPTSHFSTFPFKTKLLSLPGKQSCKGGIVVGDDVWLATDAIILSNVNIGRGAIVCAGAVVTKDVPPYAIVAGVPAKLVRYRFDEKIIKILSEVDFSALTRDYAKKNLKLLYEDIDEEKALLIRESLNG
ncbi:MULTISPECIES: CatB-related O-acetyltransferase [unclassified Adlercreutzia]|uniref:CatB-related O-acetyltransferase n=2 Tax=Adlercreutzia TaxID=447020 RepID=UPI0013ECD034|nr:MULTISPECIES: CatB-related O-acetyltransferase [unclassified Adlercreutzia]